MQLIALYGLVLGAGYAFVTVARRGTGALFLALFGLILALLGIIRLFH